MKRKAAIISIKGLSLTQAESSLLKKEKPWGIILFRRNILSFNQTKIIGISGITKNDMSSKLSWLLKLNTAGETIYEQIYGYYSYIKSISIDNSSPEISLSSDFNFERIKLEAINIPKSEPKGLNAWAKLSLRVAFFESPIDIINGLAVVSKNAKPKVNI